MPKKKCEEGGSSQNLSDKKYICQKCRATSNKKKKLCKPVKR